MSTVVSSAIRARTAEDRVISDLEFDGIIRTHQRRVYRVLYSLMRDEDSANTLTQDCFLRAHQNLDSFRGECRIDTWLLRIAVNLARDHHKNRRASFWRRLIGIEESDADEKAFVTAAPSAERVLIARQEIETVWRVVASLPQQQREIFVLRFREEMPLAEIADVLGLEVGSVKSHLFRAIGGVRKRLKEQSWK